MSVAASISTGSRFEIRFRSTFLPDGAVMFPCDAHGDVDMDRLSEEGRLEYLFARIIIRRERVLPEIVPTATGDTSDPWQPPLSR